MSDKIVINLSHLFLTSSSEIDAICHPLKKHFGVTSFVYHKNFNDGSEIKLSNQPAWLQCFYENGYYRVSGFEKQPHFYQPSFVVWSHLSHHQPILNAARKFNIDHGMTLIQPMSNGCEFYFIGTTPDKPYVTNLLLNNMDFLQRFTIYFKEKAFSILNQAENSRIFIPQKFKNVVSHELGIPSRNNIINTTPILELKKIHLDPNIILSKREIVCAKLLLQGKSARLIANELFISPRTAETHIQHLKEKLGSRTKAELLSKLIEFNVGIF